MTEHERPTAVDSPVAGRRAGPATRTAPDERHAVPSGRPGTEAPPANGGHEDLPPLFEGRTTKEFQQRWHDVQAAFVDDPHEALRQAGALNDEIVRSLTAALGERRQVLDRGLADGDTEQLRIGLRQYRRTLERLLAL